MAMKGADDAMASQVPEDNGGDTAHSLCRPVKKGNRFDNPWSTWWFMERADLLRMGWKRLASSDRHRIPSKQVNMKHNPNMV